MTSPLVTALMTTYNCAAYVEETIESILAQTYQNFIFLIVDDGSTDNTCDRIARFTDDRIRFIRYEDNHGVGYRLNEALSLINTPYIAKVDGDDISHPTRFEKQLAFLQQNPQISITKCLIEYFTDDPDVLQSARFKEFSTQRTLEHNTVTEPHDIEATVKRWSCVIHSSYFACTAVMKTVGYLPYRVGEDYCLSFNAVKQGFKIGCVKEHLLKVRLSNISTTAQPQSASLFSGMLFQLKQEEIEHLARVNNGVRIYGSGGLARAFAVDLINNGVKLHGFLDKTEGSVEVLDRVYQVTSLTETTPKGVVVAAQPIRSVMLDKLIKMGWKEWQDFIILA